MWGDSLGIELPDAIVQRLGWKEGTLITISFEDSRIIITLTKPKYTLDELLKNATPEMQHDEVDFGEPVGAEIGED